MNDVIQRYNVTVTGNGPNTLIFAHGFGCNQNVWRYIKDAFTQDSRLVLFDFIGAGKSDRTYYTPERYASMDGFATDILDICEALELKDVIFIGHSVSCMIGALAAIRQPAPFKKLVFIAPNPSFINKSGYPSGFDQETIDTLLELMEEDYISWARSVAPVIMSEKNNGAESTKELADLFCSMDPEIAKNFARIAFTSDNRKDLPFIPTPSLTIQCSDDSIAPIAVGEYIHKYTPNNTLKILNAYGHCPHMSHPEQTIAAITEYNYN
jgi:sigma-B regulation protein RsbQ